MTYPLVRTWRILDYQLLRCFIGLPYGPDMDMIDNKSVGERLRWHRLNLEDEEQDKYAARAGVARSTYANWESGSQRLSLSGAVKLRETYGLSLDFMFLGIEDTLPTAIFRAWRDRPPKA